MEGGLLRSSLFLRILEYLKTVRCVDNIKFKKTFLEVCICIYTWTCLKLTENSYGSLNLKILYGKVHEKVSY